MIRIEVTGEVITKSGIAKATGKPYEIREQVGFAHVPNSDGTPGRYPQRVLLPIRRDGAPLQAGDYQPTPACFYVGDYGTLAFSPNALAPLRSAGPAKVA